MSNTKEITSTGDSMTPFTLEAQGIIGLLMSILYLVLLWIIGRMGDNINKIRKMLEEEIRLRREMTPPA
jgi:hypothetical protein